jgi:predicted O-methyltransferase YrrM
MRQEFEVAWPSLRAGGIVVSDDIEGNAAFLELGRRPLSYWRAVRQAGKQSLLGLAVKAASPVP